MRRLTRRQALGAGTAGVAVLAGGWYGRFALGDEFEEHVASTLGVDRARATLLLDRARERLGGTEYDARAAAFLTATTFPGTLVPADGSRRRAVAGLLGPMLEQRVDGLIYLGQVDRPPAGRCQGLLRA
jgi:hypothetical protein